MKLKFESHLPKCISGILLAAAMFVCALLNSSSVRAVCTLGSAVILVSILRIEISQPKLLRWLYGVAFLAVPAAAFFIGQIMQNISLLSVPLLCILLNIAIILILQLIVLMISNSLRLSMTVGCAAPTLLIQLNTYVYMFRGNAMTPSDFLSARTAATIVADYSLLPTAPMLYGLTLAGILILAVWSLPKLQTKRHILSHAAVAGVCALALLCAGPRLDIHRWKNDGSEFNGYLVNFLLQFESIFVKEPEGYSPDAIRKLEVACSGEEETNPSAPDIIVIMDESFADLRTIGNGLSTNQEVTPFIDSLRDNTLKGYLYTSVFGGGTSNSEYEFLSGNSMAFFPQGSIVYQQYIQESPYSLLPVLQDAGYRCVAMHPYHKEGWMRNTVYPQLGFDEMYFLEDFPRAQLIREHVSDREMIEYIIDYHKQQDPNTPLFLFGITMQNHGGYDYVGPNYETTVTLKDYSENYPEAEQYLTLIRETDKAVQFLIEYYASIDRDVVIVFFGDHMPKIEDTFYEELNGGPCITLDDQMERYLVPFFIWANYDLPEKEIPVSSINYLPVYLLEAAGIPLPPYFRFLKQTEQVIPALNAYGYYSLEKQQFLPFDQAEGAEADAISAYHMLQYNNVFDDENKSILFFGN